MSNATKFDHLDLIKPETRQRCHIFTLDEKTKRQFLDINSELFHFLYEVSAIDFSVYFRIEDTMIEFIRKTEFSRELLDKLWLAIESSKREIRICLRKSDKRLLDKLIDDVRSRKIRTLMEKDPLLDRKTLDIFSDLSNASQLVVRGGITNEVALKVRASAAHLVSNLMDSGMAIATLSRMVIHDPTLYDHSASVAMLAGMIASKCLDRPLSPKECEVVAQCGLYHDVGKTCVPTGVLNKPGRFTDDEYQVMKTHALLGEQELGKVISGGAPIDELAARVAGEHHERFYGTGYPRAKQGRYEEDKEKGIHLYTRIVSIADVYSALLMKRIYKPAYDAQDAIKIMAQTAEKEYDPVIFNRFLKSVVGSLNTYQEKSHGKDRGRILYLDEEGTLREKKKPNA